LVLAAEVAAGPNEIYESGPSIAWYGRKKSEDSRVLKRFRESRT